MGITEAFWNSRHPGTVERRNIMGENISRKVDDFIKSNPTEPEKQRKLRSERSQGTYRFEGSFTQRSGESSKPRSETPRAPAQAATSKGSLMAKLKRLGLTSINKRTLLGD